VGAKPVFVDIDDKTFNLDPKLVEKAITSRTKAILPVHLYGHPCDMDALLEICRKHKLPLVRTPRRRTGRSIAAKRWGRSG